MVTIQQDHVLDYTGNKEHNARVLQHMKTDDDEACCLADDAIVGIRVRFAILGLNVSRLVFLTRPHKGPSYLSGGST